MIVPVLGLLATFFSQPPAATTVPTYVVSILNERVGDDIVLRFVLSGPPDSYSATREGNDVLVRIGAEVLPGLSLPASRDPIRALALGSEPGFSLRVGLAEGWADEMVREISSLRLVLRKRPNAEMPTAPAAGLREAEPAPSASPGPSPPPAADPVATDTADLYARLFPSATGPSTSGIGSTEIGKPENWYSDFTWLGLQARPWLSVSYVDGRTTQLASNSVTADAYWVVQPNLGLGFSPQLWGDREGQWKVNYTPRFRRLVDLNLPRLTSHFFDVGLDQPVATLGSIYASYHFSKGVLETEEIDPGREYGIGLNRVIDTSLERFRRNSLGFGVRFDTVADTQMDVNVSKTAVRYGNVQEDAAFRFGDRAFFDYDTRTVNASVRRGLGASRFVGVVFGVHDTPAQEERKQVEGRGYSYGLSLEGDIAPLTTGRILFGYRTQKNPNAGAGGQEYKDVTYGAQLLRDLSEETTIGLGADRKLYLSAYQENGFYVADSLRSDLNSRLPFGIFLRGNAGLQTNNYRASPQANTTGSAPILRKDRITTWTLGLSRSIAEWAFLRFDYTSERRNSNLDRFDIKTRAINFQLGLGFFGKPSGQTQPSW